MFMTQDDARQVFEANIGLHNLPLRPFPTIDEPFEVLISNQRRGHIPAHGWDSRRCTEKSHTKSCAHGCVIFVAWPPHPPGASNKRLDPTPAWWQTAAARPCDPS